MSLYHFEGIEEESRFSFSLNDGVVSIVVETEGFLGGGAFTSRSLSSASFLIFGSAFSVEEKSSNSDILCSVHAHTRESSSE